MRDARRGIPRQARVGDGGGMHRAPVAVGERVIWAMWFAGQRVRDGRDGSRERGGIDHVDDDDASLLC